MPGSLRFPAPRVISTLFLALLLGCVTQQPSPGPYAYFTTPEPQDPWSGKIGGWQSRELADDQENPELGPASVSEPGLAGSGIPEKSTLRVKYEEFRAERKRAMAKELAGWIQEQSRGHYLADGPIDHWATLAETLERDGDDCDGLELLTYNFLRDLGFREDEIYRAIVYRPSDQQHHMVTLWFEAPDDPWVIDPTGAMTSGMPRISEVPGWVPLKIFSETEEFTVRQLGGGAESRLASIHSEP